MLIMQGIISLGLLSSGLFILLTSDRGLELLRSSPLNVSTPPGQVTATVETDPVPNGGDAADDPAIWINPSDPSLSVIIGTDKQGGIAVYDFSGNQLQYLADGAMNNVDLRYDFPLGGQPTAIVAVSNRTYDSISIYKVDASNRQLVDVAARTIQTGLSTAYGLCMYHSPVTGRYFAFANDKRGKVEQWELFDDGTGHVDGFVVRAFSIGSQTEGCVADDESADLYISEENTGIWKYGAEPGDGTARTQVDTTGSGGHLTGEVEGLALYYGSGGAGYLIASSQGSSEFVVYGREGDNAYLATLWDRGGPRCRLSVLHRRN